MKILFISITIIIFSLLMCRGTSRIITQEDREQERREEQHFRNTMDRVDQMHWHNAFNKIKDTDEVDLPEYIKDKRVDLCFAIYKDFGFTRVPCEYLDKLNL